MARLPAAYLLVDTPCGIPQGCPLACCFYNFTAQLWHDAVAAIVPHLLSFSYLDERLMVGCSGLDLGDTLSATALLDAAFGPQLNLGKCVRGGCIWCLFSRWLPWVSCPHEVDVHAISQVFIQILGC